MGISLSIPSWMSRRRVVSGGKERNMLRNGGLLLEELLRSCDGKCNPFRIFSAKELAQATNHYQEMFVKTEKGRMYRGFINGCPIIVKCTREDGLYNEGNAINEIVFASQLNNHKNVLMLLGCCLETEVPALVYEYVDNGILSDHILHTPTPSFIGGSRQPLAWDCRLKVAKEIADSLAYLHTGLSTPIVHKNIIPDSIFLDANYVAKLSDFSLSISIPLGEEYVETYILGTIEFLPPEYLLTARVTEKCDVFSFGALLFEILSGEKYGTSLQRFHDLRNSSNCAWNFALSGSFNLVDEIETRDRNSSASSVSFNLVDEIETRDPNFASSVGFNLVDEIETRDPNSSASNQGPTDDLLEVKACASDQGISTSSCDDIFWEHLHQAIVEGAQKYIGPENMLDTHFKQLMALSKLAFQCQKGSAEERPTMTQVAKELRRIIRFHCITPSP